MTPAPIALFAYNRLAHLRQTVEALSRNRLAAETDVWVFSDAAKSDADVGRVREVRDYLPTISGFRNLTIVERDENLGLAHSIIAGVTEVVHAHGRVIVVEDDIVTSPSFLEYMNAALERYADEERVISISGYMYPVDGPVAETFFLRGADCWGWATWRRGWYLFEPDGAKLLAELRERRLERAFDYDGAYPYTQMLVDQIAGKNDSWAIRWHASAFLRGKLTLYPGTSLVQNIGNDGSGTHGVNVTGAPRVAHSRAPVAVDRIAIVENEAARQEVEQYFRQQQPLRRLRRRLLARWRRTTLWPASASPGRVGTSAVFHLRRSVRKLGLSRLPIRIVFLAGDPLDWWSLDTLYRACLADPRFKVSVVSVGFGPWAGISSNCDALFQELGINSLDGITTPGWLHTLRPDLVVTSSPYDQFRPEAYRSANVLRQAKLVYVPYGADFADGAPERLPQQKYGYGTQQGAWRIFTRSDRTRSFYRRYGGVASHRVVSLGLPVLDRRAVTIQAGRLPAGVHAASDGKFRILYNPHHSLDGWSTFVTNAPHIREFIRQHHDCYLVFRPHPGLVGTLGAAGAMSEADFRGYFSGDRCYFDEGPDYDDAFRWSDVMISDASSFLVQYGPLRKPVVYLHREDGWGLDASLSEDVFASYYVARTGAEIGRLVEQLKAGDDSMAAVRERGQARMSVGMFSSDAGRRIAAYLADALS